MSLRSSGLRLCLRNSDSNAEPCQPAAKFAGREIDLQHSSVSRIASRLGAVKDRRRIEPDVSGVVGKVSQGAVDAGFVYVTDVRAAGGRLHPIELPARLQPKVVYAAAVVKDTAHRPEAVASSSAPPRRRRSWVRRSGWRSDTRRWPHPAIRSGSTWRAGLRGP